MSKQVQYTTEFTILEGKLEQFKTMIQSVINDAESKEPDLTGYQIYFNMEETKAFIIEWFKNSEAVLNHLQNVGPLFPKLLAIAPVVRMEVFGNVTKEAEAAFFSFGAKIFKYHVGFTR